jgi:pimeloyl-ACP methyl ester carboxylesterase
LEIARVHPHSLDQYRQTVHTPSGHISAIDLGHGPVTLFVHGLGTGALLWRNLIHQLQTERRCVAIDLPLHGRSPARPDQDFSLAALAQLVEHVCAALQLEDIDLVANDTGGAIAQIFAARHPRRLASLTLTDCETHDNVPPAPLKSGVMLARMGVFAPLARLVARNPARARKLVFGSGYEHPDHLSDEMVRAFLQPLFGTAESARQFQRWIAGSNPRDLLAAEPALRELNVPTLVVWGTDDVFFPLHWAYWLKDTIPGVSEVVEIEGARLFFPDERAEELAFHLRRHWQSHPAGSSPAMDALARSA